MTIQADKVQEQVSILNKYPLDITKEALKSFLDQKPEEERKQAVQELNTAISGLAAPVGSPSQIFRNILWLIVILTFSLVLFGSFFTLARGVFYHAAGEVKPELILTMFTSVVGFIAGLFSPSPLSTPSTNKG